jgi:hypothetical protein
MPISLDATPRFSATGIYNVSLRLIDVRLVHRAQKRVSIVAIALTVPLCGGPVRSINSPPFGRSSY